MRGGRWLVAVFVVALVSVGPGHFIARSQASTATLTIHHRFCPLGVFSELYNRCHGIPQTPGVIVTLGGAETRSGQTDGEGNVTFADLTAGAYFTGDDRPGGDFTRHHFFCSAAESPGVPRPAGLGAIILAAGDDVVCDWYVTNPDMSGTDMRTPVATPTPPPPFPNGTTLTVASWRCPDRYVDSDYAATCRTTPAPDFRFWTGDVRYLDAPEAGADRVVMFDLMGYVGRTVVIAVRPTEGVEGSFASVVDCVAGSTRLHADPWDTLAGYYMVGISVTPGEDVRCDWYNVPYASD